MLLFGCLWPGDPTCHKEETNNLHLFDRIFDIWQLNCDQTRVLWGSLYSGIVHGRLLFDVLMLLFDCLWPGDPTCQKGETNNCFCLIDS